MATTTDQVARAERERREARRRDAEMAFITLPYQPPTIPPEWRVVPSERDEPEPWVPELW